MIANNSGNNIEREQQISVIEQKLIELHERLAKTATGVRQNKIADDIATEMFRYRGLTGKPYQYKQHGNK